MPLVVRAREYHLYDRDGVRYLDFFQNHGRALFGHRPDWMVRAIKETASRGLVADYPSVYLGRLSRIMEQLLPDYRVVRLYDSRRHAVDALQRVFGSDDAPLIIADPAVTDIDAGQAVAFWRPLIAGVEVSAEVLIPILPFPGNFACELVCAKDPSVADELPPSDDVSPLVLDLMVKAAGAVLSLDGEKRKQFFRRTDIHRLMARARGPYCVTGLDDSVYREFRAAAFAERVVLPPTNRCPVILPPSWTDGEITGFSDIAAEFLGNR